MKTIGIISLSSPVHPDALARGKAAIESLGYRVREPFSSSAEYGKTTHLFSSASIEARVRGLQSLFSDPEVSAVLGVRGAYGTLELLPHVKYSLLRKYPKPLIGLSDNTVLLIAAHTRAGVPAIHGPSLLTFAEMHERPAARKSAEALIQYLEGRLKNPFADREFSALTPETSAVGELIGGNLSMLTTLLGTPWDFSYDGKILFIEEVRERPFRIHRMLLQLKLAGKFDRLAGVLIGDLLECEHPKGHGPGTQLVLREIFQDCPFPVLAGLPFGHAELNLPVPLGVRVKINKNRLEF